MKNEHVVVIVDDALAILGEFSNNMDEGLGSAWRVEPGLAQGDGLEQFCFLLFHEKHLKGVSAKGIVAHLKAYLLGHLIAALSSVEAFIYSFDQVALDRSGILLTLHDSVSFSIR